MTKEHSKGEQQVEIKRSFGPALWLVVALAVAVFGAPLAGAYDIFRDASGVDDDCEDCHGDFRASPYTSLSDSSDWGDSLHNVHRNQIVPSNCDTCHIGSSRTPVYLWQSNGGTGLAAISCIGCHGRAGEEGAGLRQHHWGAGEQICGDCHSDANPSSFTPAGEDVLPPYYADPATAQNPNIPTDPCNPSPDFTEDFAGTTLGLDNDGDSFYDTTDSDCSVSTTTTTTSTTSTTTTSTTSTTAPPGSTTTTTSTTSTTSTTAPPGSTTTTTSTTSTTTTTAPPGTTTTTTLPPGTTGKVVMCKITSKGERTLLVPQRKVQRRLDGGATFGECANAPKVVMCHFRARKGTLANILVRPARVQRHLDHGDSQGECSAG